MATLSIVRTDFVQQHATWPFVYFEVLCCVSFYTEVARNLRQKSQNYWNKKHIQPELRGTISNKLAKFILVCSRYSNWLRAGRSKCLSQGKKFSLPHLVQIDSGVHPAFYPTVSGVLIPREGKAVRSLSWQLISNQCWGPLWSRSRSYFTTDSQSVSISWYRVPLWDLRPDIISCRNVDVWNLRSYISGAPSLTRGRVCNLQCNHSMVRVAQNP
jgi:hypothetical protein